MKLNVAKLQDSEFSIIKEAVQKRQNLDFFCYTLTPEVKERFQKVLEVFLSECSQQHLYNCISYCVLELLDNASKANAKRIYFQERKLNIKDANDYSSGMQDFRVAITENTKHYNEELEGGFLQINLLLSADDNICIKVANNSQITPTEYQRILDRIEKTKNYNSMADAMNELDQTEGAGWGIISIVLMLRKFGLGPDHLSFAMSDTETVVSISFPVNSQKVETPEPEPIEEIDEIEELGDLEEL